MGDWNEDIRDQSEWFEAQGLREVILEQHGADKAPATFQTGRVPIDGIFCSLSLTPYASGYLEFDTTRGDHRTLWLDIPMAAILGFNMPPINIAAARRLEMEDPRVVKRYQGDLNTFLNHHNVYNRTAPLFRRTVYPLPPHMATEYELLGQLRTEGMAKAEKECRQVKTGAIKWSPEFERAQSLAKLWTMVKKKMQGCHINTRSLTRLKRRLDVEDTYPQTIQSASEKVEEAWKHYKETKAKGD